MVVLDTDVVSELMRAEPAPAVEAWVADRQAVSPTKTAPVSNESRNSVTELLVRVAELISGSLVCIS